MNKWKKDIMIFYMFRNGIATFLVSVVAFIYHIMEYYDVSFMNAFARTFVNNIYTTLYFLFTWVLCYLCFEIYKMLYEIFSLTLLQKVIFFIAFPIVIVGISYAYIPVLFRYSSILLALFMIARTVRQIVKQK